MTTTEPTKARLSRAAQGWPAFLLRRFGRLLLSLIVLLTLAFLMIHLIPGDPARMSLGLSAPPELVEARRVEMGLNLPLWQQYLNFWWGVLTADLGQSFTQRLSVFEIITSRLGATLELALLALGVVIVVAVPTGLAAAAYTRSGRRRAIELSYNTAAGFFAVIPELLLGVVLVWLFAVEFNLLPTSGRSDAWSYVLPVAALSIGGAAAMSRIVRTEALTVLEQDYIRTARAKRMSPMRLYLRHALPNLLTSSLTLSGLMLGGLIAGSVVVETIFAWPGLGFTVVESIRAKDYPLVQAIVIVYGAIVLLVNLLVDILLVLLDPRSALKEG